MKNEAKRDMLKALKKIMMGEDDMGLGEALKGKKMSKVMVAADNPKDLEKGLDKAKEIMAKRSEMLGMDDEDESSDELSDEDDELEELKKLKKA